MTILNQRALAAAMLAVAGLMWLLVGSAIGRPLPAATQAPEFPPRPASEWINAPPLTLQSLRGKVVLIDFWTFECWNCYRSFPWLNGVEARFKDQGLAVVGVHTPEFAREKVVASIREKVREFGIVYPVMVDSDNAYWNAVGNQYWPAFYLVDRQGRTRAMFAGETHAGDAQAKDIEARIAALLAEK